MRNDLLLSFDLELLRQTIYEKICWSSFTLPHHFFWPYEPSHVLFVFQLDNVHISLTVTVPNQLLPVCSRVVQKKWRKPKLSNVKIVNRFPI